MTVDVGDMTSGDSSPEVIIGDLREAVRAAIASALARGLAREVVVAVLAELARNCDQGQ